MNDIPYDKLGISDALRLVIDPDAPLAQRMASAHGGIGASTEESLAALYVLACGEEPQVREAAGAALARMRGVKEALHQRTHPKVLEWIATVRPEPELDDAITNIRAANDRTIRVIARRAAPLLAEKLCDDHERLMLTPDALVELYANPACPDTAIERAKAFLRMEQCLPLLPDTRGAPPPPPAPPAFDLEAEIEAALAGRTSPMLDQQRKLEMFDVDHLGGAAAAFSFDFRDDDDFSLDMLEDGDHADADTKLSLEKRIAAMAPGKKIKLAYLGNKEVRNILIRDRNKQVCTAVVKAGRMTDAEVLAHAGNRNLYGDVLREICANKEWIRKYPVKVALVNNPRVPISMAVNFVSQLQKKDLESLGRNRNVSSVLQGMAIKLSKAKAG